MKTFLFKIYQPINQYSNIQTHLGKNIKYGNKLFFKPIINTFNNLKVHLNRISKIFIHNNCRM